MAAGNHFDTGWDAPADLGAAVAPNDDTDLTTHTRGLWVGTGGDLVVIFAADKSASGAGTAVTIANVPDGTLLPVRVRRVKDTGTDADDIVALY